jgi:hypothetical protein
VIKEETKMTTQEAIYKLENYDELEGKYNEALARIDEYERERKEIADKAIKAVENPGVFTDRKALTEIADMLTVKPTNSIVKPTYSDDDFEVGDVIKDVRDGQKAIYIETDGDITYNVILFDPDNKIFESEFLNMKYWQKTGKHYPQIAEILAVVRGEGENDEIAD